LLGSLPKSYTQPGLKEALKNMLGDQLGEETGKVTGFRVLDSAGPTVEVSIRTQGRILGNDYQGRTTYSSKFQPGGFLYGEGQGVYLTADGGMATWIGQGTGKMNPGGGASYRGALHFLSGAGSLAKLAGTVVVFEYSTDANDNTASKYWEWK
jgi:hypothetical protein